MRKGSNLISPLFANLFLHYALDLWIARSYPGIQFERYADDAIVHCRSEGHAKKVLEAIRDRLFISCLEVIARAGVTLHGAPDAPIERPERATARTTATWPVGDPS